MIARRAPEVIVTTDIVMEAETVIGIENAGIAAKTKAESAAGKMLMETSW
jgi:hypothetical protein